MGRAVVLSYLTFAGPSIGARPFPKLLHYLFLIYSQALFKDFFARRRIMSCTLFFRVQDIIQEAGKSLNHTNPSRTPVCGVGHGIRRGGILQTVQ